MLPALLFLQALTTLCVSATHDVTAGYYSNVTLICDERSARQRYPAFLKYWILPNQTTLQWDHQPDGKHSLSPRPVYSLTINRVEERDLGSYHCIILWDNRFFVVDTIKIDVSANYDDVRERYRKRAIIGGAAAAGAGFVLIMVVLLCYLMHDGTGGDKERDEERRAMYELDNTVRSFDEALSGNNEIALARSEIAASNAGQTTDADYATVSRVGKVHASPIETISEGSSGFFDNKLFDIENVTVFPYDESNSDMNFSREFGDQFF